MAAKKKSPTTMRSTSIQQTVLAIVAVGSVVSLLATIPLLVFAQETDASLTPLQQLRARAEQVRDTRQDTRTEFSGDIRVLQQERASDRQELRDESATMRADTLERLRTAESMDDRRAVLMDAQEKREAFRAIRVDARAQFKSDLGARVAEHKADMMQALSNAIDRMTEFLTRLDSRIEKIAENGGDTAAAELALSEATAAVVQAAADIEAADADIVAIIDGDAPNEEKRTAIREIVSGVSQSVRAAHTALKDVLTAAREAAQTIPAHTSVDADITTESSL